MQMGLFCVYLCAVGAYALCLGTLFSDSYSESNNPFREISEDCSADGSCAQCFSLVNYLAPIVNVLCSVFLFNEFFQMFNDGFDYFRSEWNIIDVLTFGAQPATLIAIFMDSSRAVRAFAAFATVFTFCKLLYYARGFSTLGPFVRMIQEIIVRILPFLFIIGLVTTGFALGITVNTGFQLSLVLKLIFFGLLTNTFDSEDFDQNWVVVTLFLICMIIVQVIMVSSTGGLVPRILLGRSGFPFRERRARDGGSDGNRALRRLHSPCSYDRDSRNCARCLFFCLSR